MTDPHSRHNRPLKSHDAEAQEGKFRFAVARPHGEREIPAAMAKRIIPKE